MTREKCSNCLAGTRSRYACAECIDFSMFEPKWECLICGGNEYNTNIIIDNHVHCSDIFHCKTCSVAFVDPTKFNKVNRLIVIEVRDEPSKA